MPTADAFEAAARTFDGAADEFDRLLSTTPDWFGPETMVGGMLAMITELTLSTASTTAGEIAIALRHAGDTCRQRAAVCRAYAADLADFHLEQRRFEASDPSLAPSGPPIRPTRPAPWVDV